MSTHRVRNIRKEKLLQTRNERREVKREIILRTRRTPDKRFKNGRPPRIFTSAPHMLALKSVGALPDTSPKELQAVA